MQMQGDSALNNTRARATTRAISFIEQTAMVGCLILVLLICRQVQSVYSFSGGENFIKIIGSEIYRQEVINQISILDPVREDKGETHSKLSLANDRRNI